MYKNNWKRNFNKNNGYREGHNYRGRGGGSRKPQRQFNTFNGSYLTHNMLELMNPWEDLEIAYENSLIIVDKI
uniref:Uncharacterized protein n=1 Tax=Parastrongyloides trichosuri TaxID=131310 RepID=A0A0N4Z2F3_PARTI